MRMTTAFETDSIAMFWPFLNEEVIGEFDYESENKYQRIRNVWTQESGNTVHQQKELKWYPGVHVDEGMESIISFFMDWGMRPLFSCIGRDEHDSAYICFLGSHKRSLRTISQNVVARGGRCRVEVESNEEYNGAVISVIRFSGQRELNLMHELLDIE